MGCIQQSEAMSAFGRDIRYPLSVLRAAAGIRKKKRAWEIRAAVKRAEGAAKAECVADGNVVCYIASACGTGTCPYSTNLTASVTISQKPGKGSRPVASAHPSYDPEIVVRELYDRF